MMKYNTDMLAIELQRVFHPIKAYKTYWEELQAIIECLNSHNKKMEDSIKEEEEREKILENGPFKVYCL